MNGLNIKSRLKKNGIKEELRRYFLCQLLIFFLVLAGITGMCVIFYSTEVKRDKQLTLLNTIYSDLRVRENQLYGLKVFGDEEVTEEALDRLILELRTYVRTDELYRDTEELLRLIHVWVERTQNINSDSTGITASSTQSEVYREGEEIYQYLENSYPVLYQHCISSYSVLRARMFQNLSGYMISFGCAVILWIIFIRAYARHIEETIAIPVRELTNHVEALNYDSIENKDTLKYSGDTNEDIRILVSAYRKMIMNLSVQLRQKEELMALKMQLKEQELKELQAQVNPHFLFNTLNMIAQTAHMAHDEKTEELLSVTSDFLRYSLDYSGKTVTIGQELENLNNYIMIQEQRFGSRIHFYFDLDESQNTVRIPSMILQPLVENAIKHGIGAYIKGGMIWIRTRRDPTDCFCEISIEDNGIGIEEEELQKINSQMRTRAVNETKIGLRNVYWRLSLFFNGASDVIITSEPRVKTEIKLRIPSQDKSKPDLLTAEQ